MFRHYLITRFNVRYESWLSDKAGNEILGTDWLEHRFALFEKYCLPSVLNQKNQQFTWILCVNNLTHSEDIQRLKKCISAKSNTYILPVEKGEHLHVSLADFISGQLEEKELDVITTRLDNDDLIQDNFIDIIQRLYKERGGRVLDLVCGYQLDITRRWARIYKIVIPQNHFISVVEKADCLTTVLSRQHHQWRDVPGYCAFSEESLWIELIHSRNKQNVPLEGSLEMANITWAGFGLPNSQLIIRPAIIVAARNVYAGLNRWIKRQLR